MNVYLWLAGIFLVLSLTAGLYAAMAIVGAMLGLAVLVATMTAPIWITYYIVKFIDSIGKK